MRRLSGLILASGILIPAAWAQKPPSPSPPPPTAPPPVSTPRNNVPFSPNAPQPYSLTDLVLYLSGSVKTDDGTPLPSNVLIERVCSARIRQQVYVDTGGGFNMDLGTMAQQTVDASGDSSAEINAGTNPQLAAQGQGIPRQALLNCELRASVAGFRSDTISLSNVMPSAKTVNIGAIVVHRGEKVQGQTLNAKAYRAPKNAIRAYEKGLQAQRAGKLPEAQHNFQEAVKIYPQYAYAWYSLGEVLQKQTQKDAAKSAFERAMESDSKFLPPCLALASLAYEQEDWHQVLGLTRHILNLDTLDYGKINGYVLDLDSLDYSLAYFYNAAANFMLGRIEEAEKSGLQAERLDVRPLHPQLRLLMAAIFTKKNNYGGAMEQLREYLRISPNGQSAPQAREQLAQLEKMNVAQPPDRKAIPN